MTATVKPTRDGRPTALSLLAFHRTPLTPANLVALLAPGWFAGVAVATTSGRARPALGRVLAWAAGGAAASLLIARAIDEVRWRTRAVSLEVKEPDAALDLMQAVRAEGVRAEMVRADHVRSAPAYAVRYRAKDDRRVRAVLAEQQG